MKALAGALLAVFLLGLPVAAQSVRIATFNAALSRSGPGLLVQALQKGSDPQIASVVKILAEVRPDIVLVTEFDYDFAGIAAGLFQQRLREEGLELPYFFAGPVNSGVPSTFDLDGDGKTSGPGDAFGYGRFAGQEGMLLLSVFPIIEAETRQFQKLLWVDLPDATLPQYRSGAPFPSAEVQEIMRLASKSFWDVPVSISDDIVFRIFASHATPPVFDGREDRNGLRNQAEISFWLSYLDGTSFTDDAGLDAPRSGGPFAILGDLNADPADGDGKRETIAALLAHPLVRDVKPASKGAVEAAQVQGGANRNQKGSDGLDTADWNDARGPGNLRVDYVLPSRGLRIAGAGVFWPASADPLRPLIIRGERRWTRHRLVWVDIDFR